MSQFLQAGQVIELENDQYKIIEAIGSGGCGAVWEVERLSDAQRLALKTINVFHDNSRGSVWRSTKEIQSFIDYAQKEIEFLASLGKTAGEHFIVPLLDKGVIQQGELALPTFIMPLYPEGDLNAYRKDTHNSKAFSFVQLIQWAVQLSDALAYVHQQHTDEQPSVHRDLKPANVLLDAQQNIALIDFGVARAAADTGTSTVGGTYAFSAPEQLLAVYKTAQGHNQYLITPAADMYALGVLLSVLLAEFTQAQLWLSKDKNKEAHSSLLPKTDHGQFKPIGHLGKVGGLTQGEQKHLTSVVQAMLQKLFPAPENTPKSLKRLPNIPQVVEQYLELHTHLLAPWPYDRPSAQQALKRFKQIQTALNPTIQHLSLSPNQQQITQGDTINLTLQFQGSGLSAPQDWLNLEFNGKNIAPTIQASETVAWLFPQTETHDLTLSFTPKTQQQGQHTIRVVVLCQGKTHEASASCTITLSAQQLWDKGETLAALKRELRREWLERLVSDAKTFEAGLTTYQQLQQLESIWATHPDLQQIQQRLLHLPLGQVSVDVVASDQTMTPTTKVAEHTITPASVDSEYEQAIALLASLESGVVDVQLKDQMNTYGERKAKLNKPKWVLGVAGLLVVSATGYALLGQLGNETLVLEQVAGESEEQLIQVVEEQKAEVAQASETKESPKTLDIPEMVKIPAGTFTMGCVKGRDDTVGKGCDDNEKPARKVEIAAFRLAKTEVTNQQYNLCVKAGACKKPQKYDDTVFSQVNHPVVGVSWNDAQAYVKWLAKQTGKPYRLPTEAEWEYAARAGSKTAYPWGSQPSHDSMNCGGMQVQGKDRWKYTSPVANFSPNAFGLYDMHGNVWEWVQDRWHDGYQGQGAPRDGRAWESGDSFDRVLRGGSWHDPIYNDWHCRSAIRFGHYTANLYRFLGFRIALGH